MTDIVYKACGEYIVELKRLPDTVTNESRDGVVDSRYAKFRGNKFFVHSIKHKITNENISEIENTVFIEKTIKYIVGEEVSTEFCKNLTVICAEGIHFFTSYDAAYNYLEIVKNGICKLWFDNGRQSMICSYKDGQLDGEYRGWYDNGKQARICNYKCDKLDGKYCDWYENGKQAKICNYKDDILDGEYSEWYENGKQLTICNYEDGKCYGISYGISYNISDGMKT